MVDDWIRQKFFAVYISTLTRRNSITKSNDKESQMTKPLIIDCDPGVDDAIALLLTFASPEFDLLGITTVAGNVPLALTQSNARKICELAGQPQIRVYAGCPRPMMRSLTTAEEVHGLTGLQGANLPEPQMPLQTQHAVEFLIETLMTAPEPVTIATLGPLTNLAIALIQEPRIAAHIKELVLMGGATTHGNITPAAEFNIYVDPHAAHVVLTSEISQITMIGLDVTHQVITTPERLEDIGAIATPVAKAAAGMLAYYGAHDIERYGMPGGPLHDPCVIAYLLRPELFTSQVRSVAVETSSPLSMGQTLVDIWQLERNTIWPQSAKVNIVRTVNAAGFYHLLIERLARL